MPTTPNVLDNCHGWILFSVYSQIGLCRHHTPERFTKWRVRWIWIFRTSQVHTRFIGPFVNDAFDPVKGKAHDIGSFEFAFFIGKQSDLFVFRI
ncbi:hypothetical protein D3C87_1361410 [compost metagenome]